MDSSNLEVLKTAHRWLQDHFPVVLVTLVHTWGSAPRPPGSLLAIRNDGLFVGSLSGGCIETDLLERVRRTFPAKPEILWYGVTSDQAQRFGLPCGGKMELVLEPLHAAEPLRTLLDFLERGQCLVRTLDLSSGKIALDLTTTPAAAAPERTPLLQGSEQQLRMRFGPRWRLLIIGAGEISRYLAEMAKVSIMISGCAIRAWTSRRRGRLISLPFVPRCPTIL